jgi:hypothetical protein
MSAPAISNRILSKELAFILVLAMIFCWVYPSEGAPLDSLSVGAEGYDLAEDTIVLGDVTIQGGILDINGHSLVVEGDLIITGDDSILKMVNTSDVVDVAGNALFAGASSLGYLTAGELRVAGDFEQEGGRYSSESNPRLWDNKNSFTAGGTHKVVLNGAGPQVVTFQNPSAQFSRFQHLEINKPGAMREILSDDGEALSDNFIA